MHGNRYIFSTSKYFFVSLLFVSKRIFYCTKLWVCFMLRQFYHLKILLCYCFFTKFCRCEFLMCRNRSDENMLDIYYISHVDAQIKRKIYIYWEWFLSQGEHRNLCGTVVAKKLSIVVRAGQILLQTFVIIYALGGCAADVQPPQKLTLQMQIFVSKL